MPKGARNQGARSKSGYQRTNGRWEARYRPQCKFELTTEDPVIKAGFRGFRDGYYRYEFLEYFDSVEDKDKWLKFTRAKFSSFKKLALAQYQERNQQVQCNPAPVSGLVDHPGCPPSMSHGQGIPVSLEVVGGSPAAQSGISPGKSPAAPTPHEECSRQLPHVTKDTKRVFVAVDPSLSQECSLAQLNPNFNLRDTQGPNPALHTSTHQPRQAAITSAPSKSFKRQWDSLEHGTALGKLSMEQILQPICSAHAVRAIANPQTDAFTRSYLKVLLQRRRPLSQPVITTPEVPARTEGARSGRETENAQPRPGDDDRHLGHVERSRAAYTVSTTKPATLCNVSPFTSTGPGQLESHEFRSRPMKRPRPPEPSPAGSELNMVLEMQCADQYSMGEGTTSSQLLSISSHSQHEDRQLGLGEMDASKFCFGGCVGTTSSQTQSAYCQHREGEELLDSTPALTDEDDKLLREELIELLFTSPDKHLQDQAAAAIDEFNVFVQ